MIGGMWSVECGMWSVECGVWSVYYEHISANKRDSSLCS